MPQGPRAVTLQDGTVIRITRAMRDHVLAELHKSYEALLTTDEPMEEPFSPKRTRDADDAGGADGKDGSRAKGRSDRIPRERGAGVAEHPDDVDL